MTLADTTSVVLGSRRLAGDAQHIRTGLVVGATALYSAIATPNRTAYEKVLAAVHSHDEWFKRKRTLCEGVYWGIPEVLRLGGKVHKTVVRRRYAGPESLQSREAVIPDRAAVDW